MNLNSENHIVLSDRPELLFLLNRVVEGTTEFLNGSSQESKKLVYKYRFNYWIGILLRKILNIDSFFYEFKWHVTNYLLALIENGDAAQLGFLAHRL